MEDRVRASFDALFRAVIPAQAGIQKEWLEHWIPASAGTTSLGSLRRDDGLEHSCIRI
jgi:hypothetical protein